jgi:cytochrome c oxidase accessory protein FixG
MACVNVCPMGIDIRDGQQMACITCGLCIDACDDVMDKIGKPRGLIDYFTLKDEAVERSGGKAKDIWKHILRPRTLLYTGMWAAVGVGLLVALFIRSDVDMTVAPVRNPLYITLSDGTIRNVYEVRIRNMSSDDREFRLGLNADGAMTLSVEGSDDNSVTVAPQEMAQVRVYVDAAPGAAEATAGKSDLRLWIEDAADNERAFEDTHFSGTGQ